MPDDFREPLPVDCPPTAAQTTQGEVYWRMIPAQPAVDGYFDSHAKRKPGMNYGDRMCKARGVSLLTSLDACRDYRKLRRMAVMKFAVQVLLSSNAGLIEPSGTAHVTWWPYKNFDPLKALLNTEPL
jgi:hypothetical protein